MTWRDWGRIIDMPRKDGVNRRRMDDHHGNLFFEMMNRGVCDFAELEILRIAGRRKLLHTGFVCTTWPHHLRFIPFTVHVHSQSTRHLNEFSGHSPTSFLSPSRVPQCTPRKDPGYGVISSFSSRFIGLLSGQPCHHAPFHPSLADRCGRVLAFDPASARCTVLSFHQCRSRDLILCRPILGRAAVRPIPLPRVKVANNIRIGRRPLWRTHPHTSLSSIALPTAPFPNYKASKSCTRGL
jgi:hypothetical protein